jgi:hypothetical protein
MKPAFAGAANPIAQAASYENVEYVLRDSHGNIKPIFQEYRLTQWLITKGYLSPLWINSPYAQIVSPFLGYWAASKRVRNGIPTVGKALIAGRLNASGAPAAADYIAVGTGTTAFAAGDTTLQTETAASGLTRAQGTVSLVTTTTTNDTAQVTKTFTVSGTVAVTESGLFNASSSGTLAARQTFTAINVVSGDSLAITWKVQIT